MTFTEIYEQIIPYWGFEIDFSDGEDLEPGTDEGGDYFFSARFSSLWKNVEREVGYENSFHELMVWTMYQVFHGYAKNYFKNGVYFLEPLEVDRWEIETQYFINLKDIVWKKEYAQYERI